MRLLSRVFVLIVVLITMLNASTTVWAQDAQVLLTCRVEPSSPALNGQTTLIIEVANVQNLYGYELNLTYDAGRVQIQDADAAKEGLNLQLVDAFHQP